jgi:hypothetical protein
MRARANGSRRSMRENEVITVIQRLAPFPGSGTGGSRAGEGARPTMMFN